ncbi:MAG: hypothetical protein QXJ48_02210 [Candidatus Korarchaeum sp.]
MRGRVLSYLGETKEYLADHVNLCLKYWERLRGSSLGRFGLKLSERFEDIIRISIVFHDFGKAFYEGESFRGHELISAYLLDEYRREFLRGSEESGVLLYPSLFSVLFHHHPMDLDSRMKRLYLRLDASKIDSLRYELSYLSPNALFPNELEVLDEALGEIKRKIKGGIRIDDVKNHVMEIIGKIFNYFIGGKPEEIALKKLSYLSLAVLVIVDYLAAGEVRGGETEFGGIVREIYDVYRMIPNGKVTSSPADPGDRLRG